MISKEAPKVLSCACRRSVHVEDGMARNTMEGTILSHRVLTTGRITNDRSRKKCERCLSWGPLFLSLECRTASVHRRNRFMYRFSAKSSSNPKYRRTDEEKSFRIQWNSTFFVQSFVCVLELLAHQCEIDAGKSNFCGMPCDDYGCDIFN